MNRITSEQREAIVRKAIAERDALLDPNDGYPEGFDASCGLPAWAMREANMTAASLTGNRQWDVPCIAAALAKASA